MNKDIICSGAFPPKDGNLIVTWSLLTKCNYNCSYCMTKGTEMSSNKAIADTIEFLLSLKNYNLEITIFGGEPTIDKRLYSIAKKLRMFAKVIIFTNLSASVDTYKDLLNIGCFLNVSYHGRIIRDNHDFLNKMQFLFNERKDCFNYVNILLDEGIEEVLEFCKKNGINHRLSPIIGESKKSDWIECIKYNNTLTDKCYDTTIITSSLEERKLIDTECMFLNYNKFKNYICYAGYSYIFIDHKGLIYRCVNDYDNNKFISSVKDKFIQRPSICEYDTCNCEFFVPKEIKEGMCNLHLKTI